MLILDFLIDMIGYATARFALPLLSFQKIYAQPVRSDRKRFNALGYRFDENKRIEVEATMAGWIGVFIWIIIFIIIFYFVRTVGKTT
jgi:hypothetical protein